MLEPRRLFLFLDFLASLVGLTLEQVKLCAVLAERLHIVLLFEGDIAEAAGLV